MKRYLPLLLVAAAIFTYNCHAVSEADFINYQEAFIQLDSAKKKLTIPENIAIVAIQYQHNLTYWQKKGYREKILNYLRKEHQHDLLAEYGILIEGQGGWADYKAVFVTAENEIFVFGTDNQNQNNIILKKHLTENNIWGKSQKYIKILQHDYKCHLNFYALDIETIVISLISPREIETYIYCTPFPHTVPGDSAEKETKFTELKKWFFQMWYKHKIQ